jgi:formylglycine-generating enzyme required for sulfatase activity
MADQSDKALKVFISYSRKDLAFADRLVDALIRRGFDVLIDRRDLPKLQDWERELLGFIRHVDTVIFIVSSNALKSKICAWEVEQVRLHAKRLAPVVIENVDSASIPKEIARINYMFFLDDSAFEERCDELARALNTDNEWLKEHTRLGYLARRWVERGRPEEALIRGRDLDEADAWAARKPREAPIVTDQQREFLLAGRAAERAAIEKERLDSRKRQRLQRGVGGLLFAVIVGLIGWINQEYIKNQLNWYLVMRPYRHANFRPHVLTFDAERLLEPGATFRECVKNCPEMVVIPAGRFEMGSPESERDRYPDEGPPQRIVFERQFAVSRFSVTFDEWDACAAVNGCPDVEAGEMGRGLKPVINVTWFDAVKYVNWLSLMTGRKYRLLSEAEWEYAARGGTTTAYPWGDDIGVNNANCNGCGPGSAGKGTSPVNAFKPNDFGLVGTHGNVWQWLQDCYVNTLSGISAGGSARTTGECGQRVL